MAQSFLTLEQCRSLKVKPEEGELRVLTFLAETIPDDYEVYFQPFLNGDRPDIVLMHRGSGAVVIEVKDWALNNGYRDERHEWRLGLDKAGGKSLLEQVAKF